MDNKKIVKPEKISEKIKLIVDNREKIVFDYKKIWDVPHIEYEIKTITTGDYILIDKHGLITGTGEDKIMAVIERKSYEDFAASLKDGRIYNKEKLIKLREQTGCKVFILLEGKFKPDGYANNIPMKAIESHVFHLMFREDFLILYSSGVEETVKLIERLCKSLTTLKYNQINNIVVKSEDKNVVKSEDKNVVKSEDKNVVKSEDNINIVDNPTTNTTDIKGSNETEKQLNDLLTQKHIKTDEEIACILWSKFRGITGETANLFLQIGSIYDLFNGQISVKDIQIHGKKLHKTIHKSFLNLDSSIQIKILSEIPGVSAITAKEIYQNVGGIIMLVNFGEEVLATKNYKPDKKIGTKRAQNIYKFLTYKK